MRIFVNDEPRDLDAADATVDRLMAGLGLPSLDGVAVAVNDGVTPRARWAEVVLAEGDRVLVIRATQGG